MKQNQNTALSSQEECPYSTHFLEFEKNGSVKISDECLFSLDANQETTSSEIKHGNVSQKRIACYEYDGTTLSLPLQAVDNAPEMYSGKLDGSMVLFSKVSSKKTRYHCSKVFEFC